MVIQRALFIAIGATGDDGLNARGSQVFQDRVRIVGFVGSQTDRFEFVKQRQRFGAVARLAAGQPKAGEHTQSIDQRVNLGGQSAPRAADRLIAIFWGAPAACWWARTMVLSMKTSSKPASTASVANSACHTCARDHLAKRLYTLFHGPKSGGDHAMGCRCEQPTARLRQTADCPPLFDPAPWPCRAAGGPQP